MATPTHTHNGQENVVRCGLVTELVEKLMGGILELRPKQLDKRQTHKSGEVLVLHFEQLVLSFDI